MNRNDTRRATDVLLSLARFALAGLLAVAVAGFIGVTLQRHAARNDAINDAIALARLAGSGVVQPNITSELLAGDPAAIERVDRLVRSEILSRDGVERVKVWTGDGKIVYSDMRSLIGRHFVLPEEDREALERNRPTVELTHLRRAENRFDRLHGKLLEVYLPIKATTGEPMLFELYQRQSAVATDAKQTWLAFAPALIGALVLLQLLQLPLAHRMARTLQHDRQEREALLLRALAASDTERRQIAADLHDGVVQDLAGTSFALAAAANRVDSQAPTGAAEALREGARQTRRGIRQLRTLLVDIYPPDLHRAGLPAALSDLVASLESRGVQAQVDLPSGLRLAAETEVLIFRTAQEALRNVIAHSGAGHVQVELEHDERVARLTVADDGCGFGAEEAQAARADGHLGLRVLADMAADAGGRLDIDSERGGGTRVRLEVPIALAAAAAA